MKNELNNALICVYGCGECGLRIYLLLREKGIKIKFFSDRDRSKSGHVVDGIPCITYDELLMKKKEDITLVVAIANGEGLVQEFQKLGFKRVLYHENVRKDLYADLTGESAGEGQREIDDLRKLKQSIEELAFAKESSAENKRDSILRLVAEWQGAESDETAAGKLHGFARRLQRIFTERGIEEIRN